MFSSQPTTNVHDLQSDINMTGPHHFSSHIHSSPSLHSRSSSTGSTASTCLTPALSSRSHAPWQSSNSSIGSAPDSPVMVKSSLDDLLEAPEEADDIPSRMSFEHDFCICDHSFCMHQRRAKSLRSVTAEWAPGDDAQSITRRSSKRQKSSSDFSMDGSTSRFGRRFNSISRRWRDSQATTTLSSPPVYSTPPRRSSSLRLPSVKSSLNSALDLGSRSQRSTSLTATQAEADDHIARHNRMVEALSITAPPTPIEEDPFDRLEMSRTPLLPPLLDTFQTRSEELILQSPLQSPSIASRDASGSRITSPAFEPNSGLVTPPLSTKPSFASFRPAHQSRMSEIPAMDLRNDDDEWALKLGHANFRIFPEPYMPEESTKDTCKRLVDDWESARMQYMRKITDVAENYGPASETYKYTQQKWSQIDDLWRYYHGLANAKAGASGEDLVFQPLAEHGPVQKMPSLKHDPSQPEKFPDIQAEDIVGPMVQYAKLHDSPARKPTAGLLRIFTDSASLLGKLPFTSKKT